MNYRTLTLDELEAELLRDPNNVELLSEFRVKALERIEELENDIVDLRAEMG